MKKLSIFGFLLFSIALQSQILNKSELAKLEMLEEYEKASDFGKNLLEMLQAEQFESLVDNFFNDELRAKLDAEKLRYTWQKSLIQKNGEFESFDEPKIKRTVSRLYYLHGFSLEKQSYDLQFSLNENDLVSSFFISSSPASAQWKPADDIDLNEIEIKKVLIGEKEPLLGEFVRPINKKEIPIVVMVHGSGQNDMDESLGPNKLFKDLAYGLAMNGIGSIRYNKRSFDRPNEMLRRYNKLNFHSIVDQDAKSAIKLANTLTNKGVFLIGHSLGGHLAPRIASEEKLTGIIIMAGNSSPLKDLLLPQYEYLIKNDTNSSINEFHLTMLKTQLKNLEKGNYDSTTVGPILPLSLPATFWMDLKHYDPVKMAKKIDVPFFVMSGERDYQVPPAESEGWKSALKHSKSRLHIYPSLNHLFFAGEGLCLPAEYEQPNHLNEQVLKDIGNWINEFEENE